MAMRPGSARIVAIGDTGAGSLGVVLTTGVLTGAGAASVCTGLVGCVAAEELTTDVAALGADDAVAALTRELCSAVTRGWVVEAGAVGSVVGDPAFARVVLAPVEGFTELTPVAGVGGGAG